MVPPEERLGGWERARRTELRRQGGDGSHEETCWSSIYSFEVTDHKPHVHLKLLTTNLMCTENTARRAYFLLERACLP